MILLKDSFYNTFAAGDDNVGNDSNFGDFPIIDFTKDKVVPGPELVMVNW